MPGSIDILDDLGNADKEIADLKRQLDETLADNERLRGALVRIDCTIIDPVDYPGFHLAQARMMRGYARQALAQGGDPTEEPEQGEDCPQCGGSADNGHDREVPPNPYYCKKCQGTPEQGEE